MPDTPRVGFVGGGTVARWHGDTLRALGLPIRAIADIDSGTRDAFAARYDVPETYASYETMVTEAGLDIVVCAVPNAVHTDCAVAALDAGTTVVIEKPLAASLAGAKRIAAAEAESEGTVVVGFMRAFEPAARAARETIADGELGAIYEIDVENVRRRGIPRIGSWFTRKESAGGGAVVDIGVHVLHLGLALLDFPTVERVSATTHRRFGDRPDYTYLGMWGGDPLPDGDFSVEDSARALIRTEDATIHLRCAWAVNGEATRRVRVFGDRAGLELTPGENVLERYGTSRGGLSDERLRLPSLPTDGSADFGPAGAFRAQWEYVLGVVRGDREHTRNTVSEGLAVQRVIESIYESAESGSEVSVADL